METQVFSAVTGSQLYGCARPDSDTDVLELYIEDQDDFIVNGRKKTKQTITDTYDTTVMGLATYLTLLAAGSPNNMSMLFHPHPDFTSWQWDEVLESKHKFVTVSILKKFSAAAVGSFQAFKKDPIAYAKKGATGLRWLSEGLTLASEGCLVYPLDEETLDDYLAVREKVLSVDEVTRLYSDLEDEFENAIQTSDFPDKVDLPYVNDLIVRLYRGTWG